MRFKDYVGLAVTMWKPIGRQMAQGMKVTTCCKECGATHTVDVPWHSRGVHDVGTVLHESWCSVDMRNIRQSVTAVRRC